MVDGATGAPLARVLVVVEGTDVSTQTDPAGRFELRVPQGSRRLFVSVVGYALLRRDIEVCRRAPIDVAIALSEGTGTYTETVTVARRTASARPNRRSVAQHLLGSADLQNLRGVLADDPLRAVQVLPGVVVGRRPAQRVHRPRQRLPAHQHDRGRLRDALHPAHGPRRRGLFGLRDRSR